MHYYRPVGLSPVRSVAEEELPLVIEDTTELTEAPWLAKMRAQQAQAEVSQLMAPFGDGGNVGDGSLAGTRLSLD